MHQMWNILLKGLGAILPVGLTLYLIYWLGRAIEGMLRPAILSTIPERYYMPGMGLIAGLVLLFFVGVAVNAWVVRRVLRAGEDLLERIPLVKSIYRALRDFVDFFSAKGREGDMKQVVLVTIAGTRLLGFITRESITEIPELEKGDKMVAVYLPMSYQIGGFTVYLPRAQVETVDMGVEDAMRIILMAGLSHSNHDKEREIPETRQPRGSAPPHLRPVNFRTMPASNKIPENSLHPRDRRRE